MKFRFQCSWSFIGTEALFFIHVLSMAALQVTLAGWEVARKTVWPSKPEIFTIWFFRDKSANSVLETLSSLDVFKFKTCLVMLTHSKDYLLSACNLPGTVLDTGIKESMILSQLGGIDGLGGGHGCDYR